MNILINNTRSIAVQTMTFSGGEVQVKLLDTNIERDDKVTIKTRLTSTSAIMELMLVVDAIRRIQPDICIELEAAYFPYARQDRVCDQGEALSASVIASMINALSLNTVTIIDPHSDVVSALLNNVNAVQQDAIIRGNETLQCLLKQNNTVVVAPDAGASKKTMSLALEYGTPFIQALKKRCTKTGKIERTEICGDVADKDVVITDDICDGGATFIALAHALRAAGAKHISLFVTHGIFSKGVDALAQHIDAIYTTDSFRHASEYENHPSLTVIKL